MHIPLRSAVAGGLVAAAALAPVASASAASLTKAKPVTIVTTEFKYAPDKWSVPANADVTIILDNKGTAEHEFLVLKTAVKKEADIKKQKPLAKVGPTKPGKKGAGKIKLAAGTYQVVCSIAGHFAGGMKGTLTVE